MGGIGGRMTNTNNDDEILQIPRYLLHELVAEYDSMVRQYKETYKGYVDITGSRWNLELELYMKPLNESKKILGWEINDE
ncbi:hypothetical protein Xish_02250 [Xenorhabdus ishibashii]|uniref:Uncharacterized protein n=2 Tax=Xenorhabdus ishibashii TaxID=1034471 RepID=A0A2D0KHV4_9GAMM|nr:hypothetical protein Xish_02250 [Xenorhabdus ishibashii]